MTSTTPAAAPSSSLERRIPLSVSLAEVQQEAQKRLVRLSKTAKMAGFRPGKVPMKVVAQTYGPQAHSDAINDVVGRAYTLALVEQKLRVAGMPSIEPVASEGSEDELKFEAIVEVYPEIACPDVSGVEIKKISCEITDADLDKTLDTLRRQRTDYVDVSRTSQKGDRVTLDFKGEIDGVAFSGGTSENFTFVLGDGSMLKEFDEAATNMKAGEKKSFPLSFPADYHGKDVAGKTATFSIRLRAVVEPKVPELDGEFAKSMGIASGDLDKLKDDVRKNLSREVTNRCKSRTKASVMAAFEQWTSFDVPKALVENEAQRLADSARQDMAARGMNMKDVPIPTDLFKDQASKRVKLGLLIGEVVKAQKLSATTEQVKAFVEEMASAYEKPDVFVNWFMGQEKQRAEAEAVVIEENVVNWVLANAKVVDEPMTVESLMMAEANQAA